MEGLNYRHLLYFRMVAREGSIARAAEILNISQPTISEQIRLLEKQVAQALFARNGRRLVLTDAGRTALRYAEEIHALGDEMANCLRGDTERRQKVVRVGVMQGLGSGFASKMVSLLAGENTRCIVRSADSETITEEFKTGALDLAVAESDSKGKTWNTANTGVGIFARPGEARKFKARFPESMNGASLLVTTALSRKLEAWLAVKKLSANVMAECADSSTVEALARGGQGLAVLAGSAPEGLAQVGSLDRVSLKLHLLASAKYSAVARPIAGTLMRGLH